MSDKFRLSAKALQSLSTYLPPDLTPDQAEEVVTAAACMAEVVWNEGRDAAVWENMIRRTFEANRESADSGATS